MSEKPLSKHQLKSEATRNALLEAAEEIFARDGYERAQIDEIAKLSGRTRGAVYSQYRTKEQLFFALQEQRMNVAAEKLRAAIARHPNDAPQSLADLRELYSDLDHSDAEILDLELKLYAVRNPDCREEWRDHYSKMYAADNEREFEEVFGIVEEPNHAHVHSRILALSAVKSGLVLAMRFMPQELPPTQIQMLLKEIFDGLFPPLGITVQAGAPTMKKKPRAVARKKSLLNVVLHDQLPENNAKRPALKRDSKNKL
jgi:AcrR family transcriptional regulator